jgi:hypothetical protein
MIRGPCSLLETVGAGAELRLPRLVPIRQREVARRLVELRRPPVGGVAVLLTSNYGLQYSSPCSPASCAGVYVDSPPPQAAATGVTYSLGVTDAAGHSRTVASSKGTRFAPPTPIQVTPFPSGPFV